MSQHIDEVDSALTRIKQLIDTTTGEDQNLRKKIHRLWVALLITVVTGSIVAGGLITHMVGDYQRFSVVTQALEEVKHSLHQCK